MTHAVSGLREVPASRIYSGGDAAGLLQSMPQRLGDLVRKWAVTSPAAPALIFAGKTVSYGQLVAAVDRARQVLFDAGARPGDRIMIANENSIAAVVFILAATECDAFACPINARMSWQEVEACRTFADCRLAVYTSGDSATAAVHARAAMAVEAVDEIAGTYAIGQFNANAIAEPTFADRAEQPAVLLFSSGTSGTPKGIVLSHQAILYMGGNMAILRNLTQDDVFYNITPLSHVIGLGAMLTAAFWAGASTELVTQFKPQSFVDALQAERISYIMGVPTIFTRLLEYSRSTGRSLRCRRMRYIAVGGMPLDLTLKAETEAAFGLGLSNSYGMSEISPITRSRFAGKGASVGEPQPGISIRIVREDGGDAEPGEAGEIWVKGPNLMLGYFRDEVLSESTRRPDGFIATGDIGVMDDTGSLTLVGRIKDVIIRSGFNVYPVEVEAVLSQFPGVAMAAVVGRSRAGNEEVIAYVQPLAGQTLDVGAIEKFAREMLTPYKRPAQIIVTSELPIGPTGKVLKSRLRAEQSEDQT